MKKNEIAVVLPVYAGDNPSWFALAIRSIENQDIDGLLLIIVADGLLTEKLEAIIDRISYEGLQVIRLERNQGLAAALNQAIEYCNSLSVPYIARMDADDICHPGRIRQQAAFLEDHPEVDVVGSAIAEIDEHGNATGKVVRYPLTHDECLRFFRKRDPLAHPSVMFRNSFFHKAGLYDPAYRKNQDTMLWYKGFMNGCVFANLPDPLLSFRITPAFFSNRRNGWQRAAKMFSGRMRINRDLGFGIDAYFYAVGMFVLTLLPSGIKKLAYRLLR